MAIEAIEQDVSSPTASLIPEKTFAEFFAGIGLMRMGLELQGWKISFANDIDEEKYDLYKRHFEDAEDHFQLEDIRKLNGHDIPSVTLATASFPCNDLSLAGSRSGINGKESSMFWEFTRILKEMGDRKPPLVLLENVTGFLSSNKGEDFRISIERLNDLGYNVDAFILNATKFVPQSRLRLFVVGIQEETHRRSFELVSESEYHESDSRPKALIDFIKKHSRIQWAIRPLPELPQHEKTLEDLLEDLPDDAHEWWNTERKEYLFNQMSDRHRRIAEKMINGDTYSYGTVFRRVRNGKSMAELRTNVTERRNNLL